MKLIKNTLFTLLVLFTLSLNAQENKWNPTKIYFVRHAETVANATKVYNYETESTFSELGNLQKYAIDTLLQNYTFNQIIVSPLWRTQQTAYPYLKSTKQEAEIWPELAECCWQDDTISEATHTIKDIPWGNEIVIIDTNYFKLKDPNANREYHWNTKNYNDGMNQCQLAADSIHFKFGGRGLNVLVVGHSLQGERLIKMLTGKSVHLSNASLKFYIIEQKDGSYNLVNIEK